MKKSQFARYLVRMTPIDISGRDKSTEVNAISSKSARKIAGVFNKAFIPTNAIRLDKDSISIAQHLRILEEGVKLADDDGSIEEAIQLRAEFVDLCEKVKTKMNVVAWNVIKTEIPELV